MPSSRRHPGRGALFAVITVTLVALPALIVPAPASAFTMLTIQQRGQILRSADVVGPDGKRIIDAACVEGRLSTVDPRWAMAFLTNTRSCVRRYGGASGESMLFKRSSRDSTDWRIVGSVSETCTHHEAGARDGILRDLGCTSFEHRPRGETATPSGPSVAAVAVDRLDRSHLSG